MSTKDNDETSKDVEEEEIYFIVLKPIKKDEKESIDSKEINYQSKLEPTNILNGEIEAENKSFIKYDVYKLKIGNEETIEIEYKIGDDIYKISFSIKSNFFYYDVSIKKRDVYIDILPPEDINQNAISYYNKLQIFLDALNKNKETNKIEKLYKEAISLYKKKKDFNLLIFLFLQIYENNNLCSKLLDTFKDIKVLENIKIDKSLFKYLEKFNQIFCNVDIKTNGYDPNELYGIILCYLYFYDLDNKYLSKNKETNSKKLAMIAQFNPYFNIEDEDDKKRYVNYKDTSIFDYINFAETDEGFIKAFRALKFEEVFKENIKSYLIKMVSKIENIETFGIIMKLINLENKQDKIKEYYDLLKDKYNYIINEIELLKEEKLTKAIEILCEFITKIFLNEKNCNFIENNIEKLDNNIKSLIYNELIKKNNDEKFKVMKDYIFSYFIKNLDDADNIIKLIGNLSSEKDKKRFFKELIEQCKFKKEEFYFDHGNKKIKLLSDLNEKLKEINDEKEGNIFKLGKELLGDELDSILDGIRKDLDSNESSKNKIEEILQFKDKEKNREEIIKKLGLIKIIINDYNPEEIYNRLNEKIEKMNDIVDRLNFIKKSLSIFHKDKFLLSFTG